MKMFSGTFDRFETFRYALKMGAPDSVFAIAAFSVISLLGFIVVGLVSVGLEVSQETLSVIIQSYLWLVGFIFMYNVIKAAFECFLVEREQVFDKLRE
jgi:uncharacterized membrane protein